MKLLVDADYVVYKCCAAAETEIDWGNDVILVTSKFSDAYAAVKRELLKIINNFPLSLNAIKSKMFLEMRKLVTRVIENLHKQTVIL